MEKAKPKDDESQAQSVAMLLAVIAGGTYESVAADFGFARSTVERRVKGVAEQLAKHVDAGLEQRCLTTARRIRIEGSAVAGALQRIDLAEIAKAKPFEVISETEMVRAAHRVRVRGVCGRRDLAMFYMLFATGARPLETARLVVADYLEADGRVRRSSTMRADATIGGRPRPLYFASDKLIDSLDDYLSERVALGWGVWSSSDYRGLDPNSCLFLTSTGEPFKIVAYGEGGQRRFLCRPILEAYRKIFRNSELRGSTPLSVRKTLAAKLYERGADDEQIGRLLGIADLCAVREMVPRPQRRIEDLVENLI